MKEPRLVEVTWMDASSDDDWKDSDDEPVALVTCRTVGWLIRRDDKRLVVVQTITDDDGRGNEWSIPAGCVKKVRRLE